MAMGRFCAQVCGFSGTNDQRQIVPFSVAPLHAAAAATRGTDGKMVHVLSRPGKCTFEALPQPNDRTTAPKTAPARPPGLGTARDPAYVTALADAEKRASAKPNTTHDDVREAIAEANTDFTCAKADKERWQQAAGQAAPAAVSGAYHGTALLNRVVQLGADALIDAGALLAGMDQEQVARHLLAGFAARSDSVPSAGNSSCSGNATTAGEPTTKVQGSGKARSVLGIVFYGRSGWEVMDTHGHVQSKATSPIKEHEAFVVFDEARCRCAQAKMCFAFASFFLFPIKICASVCATCYFPLQAG